MTYPPAKSLSGSTTFILCAIPLLLTVYLTFTHFVNSPYLDQWEYIPLIEKSFTNTLSISDLFDWHNAHRILFPRLVMLALAHSVKLDLHYAVATNILMAIGIFWVCLKSVSHVSKADLKFTAPFLAVMLLSFNQWQNFLWDSQLLSIFAATVCFYVLCSRDLKITTLMLAFISAIISLYSFSYGIWCFPIALMILLTKNPNKNPSYVSIWTLLSTAAIIPFFFNLPNDTHNLNNLLNNPFQTLVYAINFLGAPFASGIEPLSFFFGFIGIISTAFGYRFIVIKNKDALYLFPLTLFAVFNALTTAAGRSNLGTDQALMSRYISVSNLFWVPIVTYTLLVLKTRRVLATVFIYVFLIFSIAAIYFGLLSANVMYQIQNEAKDKILQSDPSAYTQNLQILKQHKLSLFNF